MRQNCLCTCTCRNLSGKCRGGRYARGHIDEIQNPHIYMYLRFDSISFIECLTVSILLQEAHECSGDTLQVLLLRAELGNGPTKVLA